MSNMKLVTLDGRHTGYSTWKYFVSVERYMSIIHRKKLFFEWREWCWQEWGASKELSEFAHDDLFDGTRSSNQKWCWQNLEKYDSRIYLRDDLAASAFTLRWL